MVAEIENERSIELAFHEDDPNRKVASSPLNPSSSSMVPLAAERSSEQIYAVFSNYDDCFNYAIYAVDLSTVPRSSHGSETPLLPPKLDPILLLSNTFPAGITFCVLQSKLYLFGGSVYEPRVPRLGEPLNSVFVYDIPSQIPSTTTEIFFNGSNMSALKTGPSMKDGKDNANAVIVDLKICVFPSDPDKLGRRGPNFEVFTPTPRGGEWSHLPEPFHYEDRHDRTVRYYCVVGSKLYISTPRSIYIIDVNNRGAGWTRLKAPTNVHAILPSGAVPPPLYGAVVDNVCFFGAYHGVFELPSENDELLFTKNILVRSSPIHESACGLVSYGQEGVMTPLGSGKLCFLCSGWDNYDRDQDTEAGSFHLAVGVVTFDTKDTMFEKVLDYTVRQASAYTLVQKLDESTDIEPICCLAVSP